MRPLHRALEEARRTAAAKQQQIRELEASLAECK